MKFESLQSLQKVYSGNSTLLDKNGDCYVSDLPKLHHYQRSDSGYVYAGDVTLNDLKTVFLSVFPALDFLNSVEQ